MEHVMKLFAIHLYNNVDPAAKDQYTTPTADEQANAEYAKLVTETSYYRNIDIVTLDIVHTHAVKTEELRKPRMRR
jgi:hypothetical protein